LISRPLHTVPAMPTWRRPHLVAIAAAATVVALAVGIASTAAADTTPTWSSVTPLPSYIANVTGASITAGMHGGPMILGAPLTPLPSETYGNFGIWPLSAGVTLPTQWDAYGEISSERTVALPNGNSIIATYDADADFGGGATTFTYNFANGTPGPDVTINGGYSSFGATNDELLVTEAGISTGASVTSYAIGASGSFTQNGPAVTIYTGDTLFAETWTDVDPDASAEVVINGDSEIYVAQRSASGDWQAPVQLPGSQEADTGGMEAAVSPTGRMIVAWPVFLQIGGDSYPIAFSAAIREPGGSFTGAAELASYDQSAVTNGGGSYLVGTAHIAAGPDGTLAVQLQSKTCANGSTSTDATGTNTVWIAPPGAGLTGSAIPGAAWTPTVSTTVTALAAGDGEALIGLNTADVTNPTNTGGGPNFNAATCVAQAGQATLTQFTDSAVFAGAGANHATGTLGTGSQAGSGTVTDPIVDAAAVDPNGNATIIGSLDAANTKEYATFGAVGAAYSPPAGTGTGTQTQTQIPPPTPTQTQTMASTPTPTPTTAQKTPPKQTPAKITTVASSVVSEDGEQVVTVSNTMNSVANILTAEWAYANGFTKALAKPRRVVIASGHLRLRPHHSGTVKLRLSRAARQALARNHGRLAVTMQVTTKAAGHRTTVVTRKLTLRLGKATKTKKK
jgi:hypothetical protein